MKAFNQYKTILWDFDGVLMDSMPIRDKGFKEVLHTFPNKEVEQLLNFHKENGGLSRYVKFRHFYETIRKEQVSETQIQELAERFSEIMLGLLIDKSLLIKESVHFVKEHYKNHSFHIVSGSDGSELNKICRGVGLAPYFITIKGSPTPKTELVSDIIKNYNYAKKDCCLIGDSKNDAEAAEANNITFFGYNNPKLKKKYANYIERFYSPHNL